MFSKHLILLLIKSYLCLSEPIISPSVREILINEGDPLEITCTGTEDIDFFYPRNTRNSVTTSTATISELVTKIPKFVFERPKTVFGDTGWYGCVEFSKNQRKLNLVPIYITPDTYDEIDIKWIYVYVKSKINPFVINSEYYTINSPKGSDVILPCLTTSPEYNVTLHPHDEEPLAILDSREKLSYDPKTGFTLHDVEVGLKNYSCKVTEPYNKESNFTVNVYPQLPNRDNGPYIYSDPLQQITIGRDFSMDCSFYNKKNFKHDVFRWTAPRKIQLITKNTKVLLRNGYYWYQNKLTIKNVTYDDIGKYKCHSYGSNVVQTVEVIPFLHARKYLRVYEKYLNGIKVESGSNLSRTLKVSAYPVPIFEWINPHGHEVINDWTPWGYEFNGEDFYVSLLKNVSLSDHGFHSLTIFNSAETITVSFFVDVYKKSQPLKIQKTRKSDLLSMQ